MKVLFCLVIICAAVTEISSATIEFGNGSGEQSDLSLNMRNLLPEKCGDPDRDLFDSGADSKRRRRRQAEGEGVTLTDGSTSGHYATGIMGGTGRWGVERSSNGLVSGGARRGGGAGSRNRTNNRQKRFVTGGFNAQQGKWPWMVLLGERKDDGQLGDWFGGGTLITSRHVLSAAHCVFNKQVGSIGARLGEYDLSTTFDVIHQDRGIVKIKVHEDYRGFQNDIALLQLDQSVESHYQSIRPICLPAAGVEHVGKNVEVAGFGYLSYGGALPEILQEVPLRVSDPVTCERAYSEMDEFQRIFPGGFQGTKVCAASGDDEPRDACPGDSGGPLMARLPAGRYELVGVVSVGVGCGDPEFPGVYTKVSAYVDWVLRNLG